MSDRNPLNPMRRTGERPPRGRVALWLALGGLVATFFGTLGTAAGFGMLTAALVIGIRAKREARATGGDAAGATPAIVIGAVSVLFMIIGLIGFVIFRDEIIAFEDCSRGANTEIAREACMDEFMQGLRERMGR